jgi:hypothetical protein
MKPILVPGPPKAAFNKHRRISDLIKSQVAHLKHLEEKLPHVTRAALPQHAIVTENDAAIYIASMTRVLRSGSESETRRIRAKRAAKHVTSIRATRSLSLAAAATPKKRAGKKKSAKKTAKEISVPRNAKKATSRAAKKISRKSRGAK